MQRRMIPEQQDTFAPTLERRQHDHIDETRATDRAGVVAYVVRTQDALDRYYDRQLLDPARPGENARRYMAGCELRRAWHASGLEARVTGSYAPSVSGSQSADLRMVEALAGSRAYTRMIGLVGRANSWPVIVCACFGEPVGAGRSMMRLRLGLATLADMLRIR